MKVSSGGPVKREKRKIIFSQRTNTSVKLCENSVKLCVKTYLLNLITEYTKKVQRTLRSLAQNTSVKLCENSVKLRVKTYLLKI